MGRGQDRPAIRTPILKPTEGTRERLALAGQTDEQPIGGGIFTSRRQRESSPEDVWKRMDAGSPAPVRGIIRRIERPGKLVGTNRREGKAEG